MKKIFTLLKLDEIENLAINRDRELIVDEILRLNNHIHATDAELAVLKLKARKVVEKKKDADKLGHTSAFARAVNELEVLVKE